MTITLESIRALRALVGKMSKGPWNVHHFVEGGNFKKVEAGVYEVEEANYEVLGLENEDEQVAVADANRDGIAALRNDADELLEWAEESWGALKDTEWTEHTELGGGRSMRCRVCGRMENEGHTEVCRAAALRGYARQEEKSE